MEEFVTMLGAICDFKNYILVFLLRVFFVFERFGAMGFIFRKILFQKLNLGFYPDISIKNRNQRNKKRPKEQEKAVIYEKMRGL